MTTRKPKLSSNRKAEKKSEMLDVRLPYGMKKALVKACRQQGVTVSDTVRSLISEYVAKAEVGAHQPALKDITMTIAKNPRKTLTMTAAAALSAFFFIAQPSMADAELFASFDSNKNGVIAEDEINHRALLALDKDHNGEIKLSEFKPYTEFSGVNDNIRQFPGEKDAREVLVSYTIIDLREPGQSSINTWSASETIDVDATDSEVDQMVQNLRAKVDAGKAKGMPAAPTPPTPPRAD